MRAGVLVCSCIVFFLLAAFSLSCAQPASPTPSQVSSPTPQSKVVTQIPTGTTPAKAEATPKQPSSPPVSPNYYQGKTIDIIVSSTAGGGTDTVTRIFAAFFPRYIAGTPKVIVRNQAGGQGTIANNSFVEKAKPDGMTLIANAAAQIINPVVRPDIAHYNTAKYEQVVNITRAGSVILIRKDALNRLTDPTAKPVIVGVREGNEPWTGILLWGQEFLGWNIKWVLGFTGTSEQELSLRRGEIGILGTTTARTIQTLMDEGLVVPIAQEGMVIGGKISRRPDFPNVPIFEDVLGAKKPSGLPWLGYNAWRLPGYIDKLISAPPGTPANVMNILTEAVRAMSKDPKFDDMVKKLISPVYSLGIGQEAAILVKEVLETPPEAFEYGASLQLKFGITVK